MSPLDFKQLRAAVALPGVGQAIAINFSMVFWFAGMEQTFRLFTEDRFGMNDWQTGRIFGAGRHRRRHGSGRPHRGGCRAASATCASCAPGCSFQALAFGAAGLLPADGALRAGRAATRRPASSRFGNGLCTPTLPAFVSRRAGADSQGVTLGSLQSASALARVLGPAAGGVLYQALNPSAPYYLGALGMIAAGCSPRGFRAAAAAGPE